MQTTTKTKRSLPMLPKSSAKNSIVVYRGPSAFDGKEIVAIVTGLAKNSSNSKTGAMTQLWVLPADEAPHAAQKSGGDASVCGECPLRPANKDTRPEDLKPCYVKTFQGPLSTWKVNANADVALASAIEALRSSGVPLRLGAYGDPAALPQAIVESLSEATGHKTTGYTHAWKNPAHAWIREYTLASVESTELANEAHALGFRTFRVLPKGEEAVKGEIVCPNTTRDVQCIDCGLCDGATENDRRKNIVIETH